MKRMTPFNFSPPASMNQADKDFQESKDAEATLANIGAKTLATAQT
jgi:hypothetical protein